MGHETDSVAFLAALAQTPYRYDFYQTLRRLECIYAEQPRWGQALRPADESVRFAQEPSVSFAPAPIASFAAQGDGRPPRLEITLFGLLGPNGPMPLHITEYARDRLRHANDPTLVRFLDIFHHRAISLFYRAWAQAQPHVNLDRPKDDRFGVYAGAFIGIAPAAFRNRDSLGDFAKFFHAGLLGRQVRNAEGLVALLHSFFRVPVEVEQFVGDWMELAVRERTQLNGESARLGDSAVLGGRVWDRQHRIRIMLGPLSFRQYASFLPGGANLRKLVDCMRTYLSFELDWEASLTLAREEVPAAQLGREARLGWTTWLGTRAADRDADDLRLDAERVIGQLRGNA